MQSIAVISPSSRLTTTLTSIVEGKTLPIIIAEASQQTAVETARGLIEQGASVLISRGKTAELLRTHFNVPVVEVRHTFFDCFNAWTHARKIADKVVFLATSEGYQEILNKSRPFMQDVRVCAIDPFDTPQETERSIQRLVAEGFKVAIGGLSLQQSVTSHGLHYVMSYADEDSALEAVNEALHQLRIEQERAEKRIELESRYTMIDTIFNCVSEGIFSIDRSGIVTNMNAVAREMLLPLLPGQALRDSTLLNNVQLVFEGGSALNGVLVEAGHMPLTVNIAPIILDEQVVGAVCTLQKQQEIKTLEQKMRRLSARAHIAEKTFTDIIGNSTALQQVKQQALRFAATDSTVMIEGETGSGKELFAQGIHNASKRAGAPFVAINCAAFAPGVLESELFGYVKGAFTGALSEGKAGMFEMAHTGTIFLDEISETSPEIQLKLLRTIQERKVMRIGDSKVTPVDIRIITASNKDLPALIRQGRFREDFYYRICVLPLFLPPLRKRRLDIPELIAFIIQSQKLPNIRLNSAALTHLCQLDWPGNIRQLSNIVERLAVMAQGEQVDMPMLLLALQDSARMSLMGDETEHEIDEASKIRQALKQSNKNRALAAKLLGISTTTLWRKMKALGL